MTDYVTIGGNTYSNGSTDEGGAVRNLGNGGHRIYFFPLLNDLMTRVADSESAAASATASEGNAATSEANAAASEAAAAASEAAADTYRDDSYGWADADEGVQVTDSDGRTGYSAYHHSKKAQAAAAQTISDVAGKVAAGELLGWDLTPSGGTAEQPTELLYSRGDERVRQTLTWGTTGGADGNVTQIVHEYSDDTGTTYSPLGTQVMSYDVDGNGDGITWS